MHASTQTIKHESQEQQKSIHFFEEVDLNSHVSLSGSAALSLCEEKYININNIVRAKRNGEQT